MSVNGEPIKTVLGLPCGSPDCTVFSGLKYSFLKAIIKDSTLKLFFPSCGMEEKSGIIRPLTLAKNGQTKG